MTNSSIERLNDRARPAAHEHGPTPAEIQRWEDDGGAILPEAPDPRAERHHRRDEAELAAA